MQITLRIFFKEETFKHKGFAYLRRQQLTVYFGLSFIHLRYLITGHTSQIYKRDI